MLNEGMKSPFVCREADALLPREERWESASSPQGELFYCRSAEGNQMTRKLTSCIAAPWRVSRPRSPADLSNADRFSPASFSILFAEARDRPGRESQQPPEFFDDPNCDQIIDAITAHRADYNLKPFFYQCLRRVDAVIYRHEVMQDLENVSFRQQIDNFAEQMREVREHLRRRDKAYYLEQKQSWFADAVDIYCNAVQDLLTALRTIDVKSRGFLALHNYLEDYTGSADFSSLRAEVTHLKAALRQIEYCILVKGTGLTVRGYEGETDYSADVENTFAKFKQGAVKDYKVKFSRQRGYESYRGQDRRIRSPNCILTYFRHYAIFAIKCRFSG